MALAYHERHQAFPLGFGLLEPTNGPMLRRFYDRLSPESLYRRFLTPISRYEQTHPAALLDVDHDLREAVIALHGEEIIGVARYARRAGSTSAEMAVIVADAWQRQGVATRMLKRLGMLALAHGVYELTFTAQAENRPVVALVRRLFPDPDLALSGCYVEGRMGLSQSLS
jgi:GNAT superfamily N-acetyltransferase